MHINTLDFLNEEEFKFLHLKFRGVKWFPLNFYSPKRNFSPKVEECASHTPELINPDYILPNSYKNINQMYYERLIHFINLRSLKTVCCIIRKTKVLK